MNIQAFDSESSPGELVNTNGHFGYDPDPLPPELNVTEFLSPLTEAATALGRLQGISSNIENQRMLISPFIRKEAVLSSRIEGTRATLADVYAYEAGEEDTVQDTIRGDVREVLNYVRAIEEGLAALDNSDITIQLIKSLHRTLLTGVRGEEKSPGEFRDRQNWIGTGYQPIEEARYVLPPPSIVPYAVAELEEFVHGEKDMHPLVEIGLVHYQFETIHPFMDGNGRLGRLIISLMMKRRDLLPEPYLYLSSFFNENRDDYTDHLLSVSQRGTWGEWLRFFLIGVRHQADEAYDRAQQLVGIRKRYQETYQAERSENVLKLAMMLFSRPYITVSEAANRLDVAYQTANRAIEALEGDGVVSETTGKSRNRVFVAEEIYEIFAEPAGGV
jgi:Fic family protein